MTTDAQAAIVTGTDFTLDGVTGSPTTVAGSSSSVSFLAFDGLAGWTIYQSGAALLSYVPGSGDPLQIGVSYGDATILAPGATISVSNSFADFTGWAGLNGQSGFIGVEFEIAGAKHYGWMEVSVAGDDITFTQWAYEDTPGLSIAAGDTGVVPEPSSLALLAMGAGGLMARRRRS